MSKKMLTSLGAGCHVCGATWGHLESEIFIRPTRRHKWRSSGVTRIVRTPRRRGVWGKGVVTYGVDRTGREYKTFDSALLSAQRKERRA